MKKSISIAIIFLIAIGFLILGRTIYMPIYHKIKGKETVDSVHENLEKSVFKRLENDFKELGLSNLPSKIAICAFKEERILEVYVLQNKSMKKLKTYKFTNFSGQLGPKLKEGDKQIPEGIYKIEYLNPNSSFYLSMKINYPNAFDKQKGKSEGRTNLGSDIFIHGKSSTIGCIPIGDEAIEELFLLARHGLNRGIDVIIAPRDFRKNPDNPKIPAVNWSDELYRNIKDELQINYGII